MWLQAAWEVYFRGKPITTNAICHLVPNYLNQEAKDHALEDYQQHGDEDIVVQGGGGGAVDHGDDVMEGEEDEEQGDDEPSTQQDVVTRGGSATNSGRTRIIEVDVMGSGDP